jgi:hypothetical protein
MTTQLKETDPSEFTQHTMTEQEILAHPEFIQAKDVLEHRSLKPSQAIEISFPRDEWSVEAIATCIDCLAPYTKGCGYAMEVAADDKNEYLIFINTRDDNDSEFNPMNLSVREFKEITALECEAYSDEELQKEFRDYTEMLAAALAKRQDANAKSFVERAKAMIENILAVAYRRGLPWAVMEMHNTAAVGEA